MKKICNILRKIFAVGVLMSLFAGGLSLVGYLAALCVGGELATAICSFIFTQYFPWLIRFTSVVIGIGLVIMYFDGEVALTMKNGKQKGKKS